MAIFRNKQEKKINDEEKDKKKSVRISNTYTLILYLTTINQPLLNVLVAEGELHQLATAILGFINVTKGYALVF